MFAFLLRITLRMSKLLVVVLGSPKIGFFCLKYNSKLDALITKLRLFLSLVLVFVV